MEGLDGRFYTGFEIDSIWPEVAPVLQRSVDRANHGEFDVGDLYRMVRRDGSVLFVVWDADVAVFAMVLEIVRYPQAKSLNVVALATAKNRVSFRTVGQQFWGMVVDFGRLLGVDFIESHVSAGVARIQRHLGFEQTYIETRYRL